MTTPLDPDADGASDPMLALAEAFLSAERWEDAARILGPRIASDPDDPQVWLLMARCQIGLDEPALARDAAMHALAAAPDSEWGYRLLSIAFCAEKRFPEARRAAWEAVQREPSSWEAHYQRAMVDVLEPAVTDETWDAAYKAVELAPDVSATHSVLGMVAQRSRDTKVAEAEFQEALRLAPDDPAAQHNLAIARFGRRRLWSAGALLSSSLRQAPNDAYYAASLRSLLGFWLILVNVVGALICVLMVNSLDGGGTSAPAQTVSPAPITVTLGPSRVVTVTPPPLTSRGDAGGNAATGHPGVVSALALVMIAITVIAAVMIRRSIGPASWRIAAAAVRADKSTILDIVSCVGGTALLVVAALVGMPGGTWWLYGALAAYTLIVVPLGWRESRDRRRRLQADPPTPLGPRRR